MNKLKSVETMVETMVESMVETMNTQIIQSNLDGRCKCHKKIS